MRCEDCKHYTRVYEGYAQMYDVIIPITHPECKVGDFLEIVTKGTCKNYKRKWWKFWVRKSK